MIHAAWRWCQLIIFGNLFTTGGKNRRDFKASCGRRLVGIGSCEGTILTRRTVRRLRLSAGEEILQLRQDRRQIRSAG